MTAAVETAVATLASRALETPYAPWLFHRPSWDWEWLSWRRAADQVARGVDVLHGWTPDGAPRVAFDARQTPDSVAVGLTIQAVGATAVPLAVQRESALVAAVRQGCVAWVGIEGEMPADPAPDVLECIALPPALGALERTERKPLEVDSSSIEGSVAVSGTSPKIWGSRTVWSAARRLNLKVPSSKQRSIACAAPSLDPATLQLLQAWTLVHGAAWVLEPHQEAFVPTVLWARPTVVFGTAADLEPVAKELGARKHRRHSRLRTVVVTGPSPLDTAPWADLAVTIVVLGENPLQSLLGGS